MPENKVWGRLNNGEERAMSSTLLDLEPGQQAQVLALSGPKDFVRRLISLGLAPGVDVSFVRRAPLGDPIQILVNGANLAIRKAEARQVEVRISS